MSDFFESFGVTIPGVPDPNLSVNNVRRHHWSERHDNAQAARGEAATEARSQLGPEPPVVKDAPISLSVMVYYVPGPKGRRPDLESVMSSCKPYIDGIFDYLSGGKTAVADDAQIESIWISRVEVAQDPRTTYYFMDRRYPPDAAGRPF